MINKGLRYVFRLFGLRPHGSNLLTPGASVWLLSMALLVLIMASIEGITWGIISTYLLSSPWHLVAIVVGLIVFTLIWIFDSSLVTLDLSNAARRLGALGEERAGRPGEESGGSSGSGKPSLLGRLFSSRLGLGSLLRVGIVVTSLVVTAPLLSMLLLSDDIDAELLKRQGRMRIELKEGIEAEYRPALTAIEEKLSALRAQLTEEVAGRGTSGKFGEGPVSRTIRERIGGLEEKREETEKRLGAELAFVDRSTASELAGRYGRAEALAGDFAARRAAQRTLLAEKDSERYRMVELLARVLLVFLFLALVGLKIFQSRSVEIYLDEYLQDMYSRYLRGGFDHLLPAEERPGGPAAMTPYRFQDWIYNVYRVQISDDAMRYHKHLSESCFGSAEQDLRAREQEELQALVPLRQRLSDLRKDEEELYSEIKETERKAETYALRLSESREELERFSTDMLSGMPAEAYREAMGHRGRVSEAARDYESAVSELRGSLEVLGHRKKRIEAELEETIKEKTEREVHLGDIRANLRRLFTNYVNNSFESLDRAMESLRQSETPRREEAPGETARIWEAETEEQPPQQQPKVTPLEPPRRAEGGGGGGERRRSS